MWNALLLLPCLYQDIAMPKVQFVVACAGGYMLMAGTTARYVFDLQPGDVYWCTADCGWWVSCSLIPHLLSSVGLLCCIERLLSMVICCHYGMSNA